jgi:hypothetical protein
MAPTQHIYIISNHQNSTMRKYSHSQFVLWIVYVTLQNDVTGFVTSSSRRHCSFKSSSSQTEISRQLLGTRLRKDSILLRLDSTTTSPIDDGRSITVGPLIEVASEEELPDDFETECLATSHPNDDVDDDSNDVNNCIPIGMVTLPRHSHEGVNALLENAETILRSIHVNSKEVERDHVIEAKERAHEHEVIHANNYVDLGKIDT